MRWFRTESSFCCKPNPAILGRFMGHWPAVAPPAGKNSVKSRGFGQQGLSIMKDTKTPCLWSTENDAMRVKIKIPGAESCCRRSLLCVTAAPHETTQCWERERAWQRKEKVSGLQVCGWGGRIITRRERGKREAEQKRRRSSGREAQS